MATGVERDLTGYYHDPDEYELAGYSHLALTGLMVCRKCRSVFNFPRILEALEHRTECDV